MNSFEVKNLLMLDDSVKIGSTENKKSDFYLSNFYFTKPAFSFLRDKNEELLSDLNLRVLEV